MSAVAPAAQFDSAAYLSINNIEVIYDHVILVLKGVSLHVPEGKIVTLLGANGAGKTTTLKAISNLLRAERGDVTKGTIEFMGQRVDRRTPNELVRMGVCQVMEGRHCFQHLTVEENLLTGAFTRRIGRAELKRDLELVYTYFPRLKERRGEPVRIHVGRRAADDRARPRTHGPAEDDPAGRAVDGSRPAARRGDLRDRPRPERQGARFVPDRRAEHDGRAALRRLRLHPRERPRRDGRRREGARAERGREGVLSRPVDGGAQDRSATSSTIAEENAGSRSPHSRVFRHAGNPRIPSCASASSWRGCRGRSRTRRPTRRRSRGSSPTSIPPRSRRARRWRSCRSRASPSSWTGRRRAGRSADSPRRDGARPGACSRRPARSTSRRARSPTGGGSRGRCSLPVSARGDLVHNCFSYHFTPAGSMMETGAHALGCTVFPGRHGPDGAAGAGNGRARTRRLRRHAVVPEDHRRQGRRDGREARRPDQGAGLRRGLSAEPSRCAARARHRRLSGVRDRRSRHDRLRDRSARGAGDRRRRAGRNRASGHRRSGRARARSAKSS